MGQFIALGGRLIKMTYKTSSLISDEILHEIFNNVSDGVAVYGPDTKAILVNHQLRNFLKMPENKYLGKTPLEHMQAGFISNTIVSKAINTRKEVSDIIHTKNGDVMSRCRTILNEQGEAQFVVATVSSLSDISIIKTNWNQTQQNKKYLQRIEHFRQVMLINQDDEDFIFESLDMKLLLEVVKKVAPVDCNILITGESGVGKDIVAKTIHINSSRKNGPFIPVNIAAIPETLLEAELFGYEEGAFTGSTKGGKIGLFEIAQGGTLFLDEIGDMPYQTQVKILRAIETGEILRVGGNWPIKLDLRIISATNKELEKEVEKGSFRMDLYYRLGVVPLQIPPLRERKDDIVPLCKYFIKKFNNKYNTYRSFSIEALQELTDYNWPGNVRELKNVVERLSILSSQNIIKASDVQQMLKFPSKQPSISNTSLWEKYEYDERSQILAALKECSGNKSKTAELLGMTRSKLYRKLQYYRF